MTREEEINLIAICAAPDEKYKEFRDGVIWGAKWADKNPIPEMINKDEFIVKVKKWLEFNTSWNMEYDEEGRNPDYGKIDELVKYLDE